MSENKYTFVLVAGSWLGGWYWREVARLLRSQGHRVLTPSLAGLAERAQDLNASVNLSRHINDICGLIEKESLQDIILCGHSYGGMVISGVAEIMPEGTIRALVFLDALYTDSGECLSDFFDVPEARDSSGLAVPPLLGYQFGLDEAAALWFDGLTTPHPLACWHERANLSIKCDQVKRKVYVVATESGMPVFSEMAKVLSENPDWVIEELPCGHMVAIQMPQETANILLNAAM